MRLSSHFRRTAVLGFSLLLAAQLGVGACAASVFDAAYYAEANPDVAAACGTDEASLLRHYLSSGQAEGRRPSARGKAGDSLKLTNEQIALVWSPVPLKDLANYKSLKKKMTDEQYQAAYQQAVDLVLPVALSSREEQLTYIAAALRERFDSGMSYSMDADHYNDPLWLFCAGLCLLCRLHPCHRALPECAGHPLRACQREPVHPPVVPCACGGHLLDLRRLRPLLRPGACTLPASVFPVIDGF